ncbi:MAG: dockerin type I domain-containing protein [Candidatus Zixiibacteriota bacterium]
MRLFVFLIVCGLLVCLPSASTQADCGVCGDVTGDGSVDIADVTALIRAIWDPPFMPECFEDADMNCDNVFQIWEFDYLIAYLFENGPAPCDPEIWPNCAE